MLVELKNIHQQIQLGTRGFTRCVVFGWLSLTPISLWCSSIRRKQGWYTSEIDPFRGRDGLLSWHFNILQRCLARETFQDGCSVQGDVSNVVRGVLTFVTHPLTQTLTRTIDTNWVEHAADGKDCANDSFKCLLVKSWESILLHSTFCSESSFLRHGPPHRTHPPHPRFSKREIFLLANQYVTVLNHLQQQQQHLEQQKFTHTKVLDKYFGDVVSRNSSTTSNMLERMKMFTQTSTSQHKILSNGIQISGWTITSNKGTLSGEKEMKAMEEKVGIDFPFPEMTFGSNYLKLQHEKSKITMLFEPSKALQGRFVFESVFSGVWVMISWKQVKHSRLSTQTLTPYQAAN